MTIEPGFCENPQDHALPDQEAGERDDERRDTHPRDDRALPQADHGANGNGGRYRQQPVDLVPAAGQLELGNRDGTDAGHVADREIDLPDQEDEDDAEGEHRRPGHLDEDVVEVDRGEEVRRLEAEEDDDEDEAEDDRQDAEVPRLEVVDDATDLAGQPTRLRLVGRAAASVLADDVDVRGAHAVASAVDGIPETFVGTPAVIASTTSCWVVFRRS